MADWFYYDWEVKGKPAAFQVDLAYEEQPEGCDLLLYCAVAPLPPNEVFSAQELSKLAKIEKKLLKLLPQACYVGYIHMDTLRQFYFYVNNEEGLAEALDALSMKERKLSVHYGFSPEPNWVTYKELLYPDAAKYQTELNAQQIEWQRRMGDALDKVRKLTLLFAFPSEQDKMLFRESARQNGFAIGDSAFQPELPKPHVLTLYVLTPLEKYKIDSITTRAIRTAEAYYGDLLRWTCPKIERKSPLAK